MDSIDRNPSSRPATAGTGSLWLLLSCSIAAAAAAIALCAGLMARKIPPWMAVGAALAVFPLLPFLWHGVAEVGTKHRATAFLTGRSRLALRTLALALVVLGVSLGDLGPKQVTRNLQNLAGRIRGKPKATLEAPPVPIPAAGSLHGLESFIPADATLAVGLAGSVAMEQLLAAHGLDSREKLAALATCRIDLTNARLLIAARGRGTQMIVLRAPGIGEAGNLYCLVGVMGADQMQIRADGAGAARTLQVSGFHSRPLTFRLLDQATMIARDDTWQDTADQRLLSADAATAQGRLALPILRVDRTTPLWMVGVDETAHGTWDVALDSRQEGNLVSLHGTATPPSGEGDRAELSVRVPLAFVRALPESAVALGIRGVAAAVTAISAERSPPTVVPVPRAPAGPGSAAGAR
jgi:hypothetical protein